MGKTEKKGGKCKNMGKRGEMEKYGKKGGNGKIWGKGRKMENIFAQLPVFRHPATFAFCA